MSFGDTFKPGDIVRAQVGGFWPLRYGVVLDPAMYGAYVRIHVLGSHGPLAEGGDVGRWLPDYVTKLGPGNGAELESVVRMLWRERPDRSQDIAQLHKFVAELEGTVRQYRRLTEVQGRKLVANREVERLNRENCDLEQTVLRQRELIDQQADRLVQLSARLMGKVDQSRLAKAEAEIAQLTADKAKLNEAIREMRRVLGWWNPR